MHAFADQDDLLSVNAYPMGTTDDKLIIYQLFPRLFGNRQTNLIPHGSLADNDVGKFADINENALKELRKMGITHVWYTGIIAHASMTDYSEHGIPSDHPAVVKGQAGSPYAIKDYYDVAADLAEDIPNRMHEFEALISRTHLNGLNIIIDFIPNHVARSYRSFCKPDGAKDLGEEDDTSHAFLPNNNFYYFPETSFQVPEGYKPFGPDKDISKDIKPYKEFPAKATGNDVFSPSPSINDWFETIKLNYGIDYLNGHHKHFDPIPNTWQKMYDILVYWAEKGVDGFRCDMVHMVPVEFWEWAIGKIKEKYPSIVFIAEIYDPNLYRSYIHQGKFDYLYDKVGVYDHLRKVMNVQESTRNLHRALYQSEGIPDHMLRFLENHDEQRIASPQFAGDAWKGVPAMTVSATLSRGPVMIYFGQEVGETASGGSGFSGDDGRTTLFDYWAVPAHQKWMNEGKFDGGQLGEDERELRDFYVRILNLCRESVAIRTGHFYELPAPDIPEIHTHMIYAFLRHCDEQQVLVMANFDSTHSIHVPVFIPEHAWQTMNKNPFDQYALKDLLYGEFEVPLTGDTLIEMPPLSAYVLEFK